MGFLIAKPFMPNQLPTFCYLNCLPSSLAHSTFIGTPILSPVLSYTFFLLCFCVWVTIFVVVIKTGLLDIHALQSQLGSRHLLGNHLLHPSLNFWFLFSRKFRLQSSITCFLYIFLQMTASSTPFERCKLHPSLQYFFINHQNS